MNLLGLVLPWWAKYAAIAAFIAATWIHGWVKGNAHGTEKLTEYVAKQATEAVRIARGRDKVTTQVVTKYIRVQGETKVVTQTIEKEVVRYAQANPGYCLDATWRVLHDAAAANAVPRATLGTDVAPRAAEALDGVTTNYAAAKRNADRLAALQEWVRSQAKVK